MQLTSPAFAPNNPIPDQFTCKGAGISPPLNIASVPMGTQSLVLAMHDPDAPGGDFTHWTMWNIAPTTTSLPAGMAPGGAVMGRNDFDRIGYGHPCPPSGTHRYVFELLALDTRLQLASGASRNTLSHALQGHVLARASLIGIVSA